MSKQMSTLTYIATVWVPFAFLTVRAPLMLNLHFVLIM
jgi:hypothetical protein